MKTTNLKLGYFSNDLDLLRSKNLQISGDIISLKKDEPMLKKLIEKKQKKDHVSNIF